MPLQFPLTLVMIELNNSRPKFSPAAVYDELAQLATKYRVDSFDVYGDNDKDSDSSILRSFEGAVALLFGKDDVRAKYFLTSYHTMELISFQLILMCYYYLYQCNYYETD